MGLRGGTLPLFGLRIGPADEVADLRFVLQHPSDGAVQAVELAQPWSTPRRVPAVGVAVVARAVAGCACGDPAEWRTPGLTWTTQKP